MEVRDTLVYLTGRWALTRDLVDHMTGVSGSFAGEARVQTYGRRGRYEEHGRVRLGTYEGRAERALELVGTDGSAVEVLFTDGRPFFELDLVSGTHRAVHECSADLYELEFEVGSADLLVERWRVRGPTKNFDARTRWLRR